MNRRFWIFDLDGTLTVPMHDFAAFKRELGLPPDVPILESLRTFPAHEAAALHARVCRWEEDLADGALPAPGARALLEALAGRGVGLAVLTRNQRSVALRTLDALDFRGFFSDADVAGRHDAAPKPAPDGILRQLARWGADPADAVMVGDSWIDVDAGAAAGVATVGVGPSKWKVHPDIRVDSLNALLLGD